MPATNIFRSLLRLFTTKGDLIAFDGSNNVRLPVGSNDEVLTADSTAAAGVAWKSAGAASSPTTTKGDLEVYNGSNLVRLPVGSNDQVLTADSTAAEGVAWADASGGGLTTSRHTDTGVSLINVSLPSGGIYYEIIILSLIPSATGQIWARFTDDGFSTLYGGASDYAYQARGHSSVATFHDPSEHTEDRGLVAGGGSSSTHPGADNLVQGRFELFTDQNSLATSMQGNVNFRDGNNERFHMAFVSSWLYASHSKVDGIQIFPDSGTMDIDVLVRQVL